MPLVIDMPKLSDTMTEGTLLKWLKKVGEKVEMGDVIAEIETDKATMEMEAFDDGILAAVYVQDGGKAGVGQKIGLLALAGENPEDVAAAGGAAPAPAAGAPQAAAPETAGTAAAAPAASAEAQGRVKASPLARKLAAQRGVDLTRLVGTGPRGRIVSRDVLQPVAAPAAAPVAASVPRSAAPQPVAASIPAQAAGAADKVLPLSGMRRVIAERLVASKSTIPHFYLQIEADAGALLKLRGEINAASEAAGSGKITVNDFVLKAVISALGRVPKVNASWAGDSIIEYGAINLSVAVAVEEGLVTPVLRDAAGKSLREISEGVKDLATRARTKKLKPEEYQGGTFTVSNLGSHGILSFSAIINPPQAAILSVGAIVKKPVVNEAGQIVVGQRVSLTLSCDHRVVDGTLGSQFLGELRGFIENPALMLL
jgi:pyruvate dehydrogenase E2 component (dihydrolipoamide acetyltransferase)